MGQVLILTQRDEGLWPLEVWNARLSLVDARLHDEILNFRWPEDRQQRLISRLLLCEGLRRWGMDASLLGWQRDAVGRPLLAPTAALPQPPDFSCSHARGFTVVALGRHCRVGVDVEVVRQVTVDMLDRIFNKAERRYAEACTNERDLVEMWTRKEALLKGDGRALTINPHHVEVLAPVVKVGAQAWHVREVPVPEEFVCHVATSTPYECEMELVEVTTFP